ncbi:MAG TPA: hypothetical protein H9899_07220 [Candidatus Sphingomonas excrementigallinarum]|nr:hypothetical protein [Candidatus Sphingomonas excrementigallinarum]
MWIQFDEKQLEALTRLVNHAEVAGPEGHADAEIIRERIAWYNAPDANDQRYRDAVQTNNELEMDDDAVTSVGDEGAFVMTWTYVSNEEAGIEDEAACRTEGCDGDPDDGEGFDGFCGNCADRQEEE